MFNDIIDLKTFIVTWCYTEHFFLQNDQIFVIPSAYDTSFI